MTCLLSPPDWGPPGVRDCLAHVDNPIIMGHQGGPEQGLTLVSGGPSPRQPSHSARQGPIEGARPGLYVRCDACWGRPGLSTNCLLSRNPPTPLATQQTASLLQEVAAGYTDPLGRTGHWPLLLS